MRESLKEKIENRLNKLRINKFKAKHISKYIMIVAIILVAILLFPSTLSMYSSNGEGSADVDISYSLLDLTNLSSTIRLDNIIPNNEYKSYDFEVKNYVEDEETKEKKLIDVNMKYYVEVKTTTNLHMEYKLLDSAGNTIAENNDVLTDDYEAKWFVLRSSEYVATFNAPSEQKFTLKYRLSDQYKDSKYQDISELIMVRVHAEQITE